MTPGRVVEAFDLIEHVGLRLRPRAVDFFPIRSVLSEEKKLSMAALSHTLPDRLIEQVTP